MPTESVSSTEDIIPLQASPVAADKTVWQRSWSFIKELLNDHDFWIRALAIKGGAGAIIFASVVGLSYVVALPFLLAATGVVACTGLIAVGVYGICLGAATSWQKLKIIYSKTVSTKPPKPADPARKPFTQKLLDSRFIKRLTALPLAQKLLNSHAWRYTRAIAEKQQDFLLTGFAGGGSIFFGTVGVITLSTQIVVLPVIAVSSLLTFGTIAATGAILSATYGLYLSIQKFSHSIGEKKKAWKEKARAAAQKKPQTDNATPPQQPVAHEALTPDFNKASEAAPSAPNNTLKTEEKPVIPADTLPKKPATPPASTAP